VRATRISNVEIGHQVFVVAEVGSNHNGDFALARELMGEAAKCGVNAVKFQIYNAEQLIRPDIPILPHVRGEHHTQLERFQSLQFSTDQYRQLATLAQELGLVFFASVFDQRSVDFVDELAPVLKIASGDLTNLPLIKYLATKGKPIILSTGMASVEEIDAAVRHVPSDKLILLHCVSAYPTPIEKANLRAIPFLRDRYGVPIGYSDHTIGTMACVAAVALGAVVIEKHFTLDKDQPIGDHNLSTEPDEMKTMVDDIRMVEAALGNSKKAVSEEEHKMRTAMRRALVARQDIPAGTLLSAEMFVPLRPADGISPARIDEIVGKRSARDIFSGTPLTEADIAW